MVSIEVRVPIGPPMLLLTEGGLKVIVVFGGKAGVGCLPIDRVTISSPLGGGGIWDFGALNVTWTV